MILQCNTYDCNSSCVSCLICYFFFPNGILCHKNIQLFRFLNNLMLNNLYSVVMMWHLEDNYSPLFPKAGRKKPELGFPSGAEQEGEG